MRSPIQPKKQDNRMSSGGWIKFGKKRGGKQYKGCLHKIVGVKTPLPTMALATSSFEQSPFRKVGKLLNHSVVDCYLFCYPDTYQTGNRGDY